MRFPSVSRRGLGAGLDLPWDGKTGFGTSPQGDVLAAPVRAFLARHTEGWSHAFFSWQPRDRAAPRLEDYTPAWDDLVSVLPVGLPRALHHTALNLASLAPYDRRGLLDFTAKLCEHYDLQWINEDVGFWSLDGRAVPYPLPPLLTEDGLRATIANTRECQDRLPVPLLLEFPGFSEGASVVAGDLHAYDFFRRLAEGTAAPVTLDVGHLLSYQWWLGLRGDQLLGELDRLPLDQCFELHLSGCEIRGDAFIDAHHGLLLDEQYELTRLLLARCPAVRAVTYEDPRFDEGGTLTEGNQRAWDRLRALVAGWAGPAEAPSNDRALPPDVARPVDCAPIERALGDYLYGVSGTLAIPGLPTQREVASVDAVRRMVRERRYRGTGGLLEWYPKTVAAWRSANPEDVSLARLISAFCESAAASQWREHGDGQSLEQAFFHFFEAEGIGDAAEREDELLGAVVRALAVTPTALFRLPAQVKGTPTGVVALSGALVLHAVVKGHYVRGPVTPLLASLLRGDPLQEVSSTFSVPLAEVSLVYQELSQRGLVAADPHLCVRIEGHTDAVGSADQNLKLSDERTRAVRDYLVQHGVEGTRLEAKGSGSTLPLDTNATTEGREKNRRVEFSLVSCQAPN